MSNKASTVLSSSASLFSKKFGINARLFDKKSSVFSIPESFSDGRVPTLNKTGFMTPEIDDFVADFISIAPDFAKSGIPVLDIGCAYGVATIPALESGGIVIANDLDIDHLTLLKQKTPSHLWDNLYLNHACISNQLDLPKNSVGAILARRVTHFLRPPEMEELFSRMMEWLVPGGFLYVINISPYHAFYGDFYKVYEKRWQDGCVWPGEVFNNKDYVSDPEILERIPEYINLMDERPLKQALEKKGLKL
jgi:SAM-dependent methyltransferase